MKMEKSKRVVFTPVVITLESLEELLLLTAALGTTGPEERVTAFERQTPVRVKSLCDTSAVGRANLAIGDLYYNLADLADDSE